MPAIAGTRPLLQHFVAGGEQAARLLDANPRFALRAAELIPQTPEAARLLETRAGTAMRGAISGVLDAIGGATRSGPQGVSLMGPNAAHAASPQSTGWMHLGQDVSTDLVVYASVPGSSTPAQGHRLSYGLLREAEFARLGALAAPEGSGLGWMHEASAEALSRTPGMLKETAQAINRRGGWINYNPLSDFGYQVDIPQFANPKADAQTATLRGLLGFAGIDLDSTPGRKLARKVLDAPSARALADEVADRIAQRHRLPADRVDALRENVRVLDGEPGRLSELIRAVRSR